MKLLQDHTKFKHKVKPSWGIGVFRGYEGSTILVEFSEEGVKKFTHDAIGSMLIPITETESSNVVHIESESKNGQLTSEGQLIQFDGEPNLIGGKNVIATFEGDDVLLFNESYTVIGSLLKANKIHAMYDLTVIGDLDVAECVVNGSLMVTGNVNAASLNCANLCVIQGDADIDKIYIGGDFIANSLKCNEFLADECAVIRTTIDINRSAKIEKTIVAYEGIMGAGSFASLNAIANEYFEFDGDITGKVIELETNTTISELLPSPITKNEEAPNPVKENLSLEELISSANETVETLYKKCSEYEEDEVINVLKQIETEMSATWIKGPCNERLFRRLVDISYKEKIEDVEDYLHVLYAKKKLPNNLYQYETVEFVDSLIPDAEKNFEELTFSPRNIEEFLSAVKMAQACSDLSGVEHDELFDKIFEAIGLKYNTVKSIILRNKKLTSSNQESEERLTLDTQNNNEPCQENKIEVQKENREEFLKKKITHVAKKYGITDSELERLSAIRVRTCGDFIAVRDEIVVSAFGRKAFLATHLIQVKNKMAAKAEEML